MLQRATDENVPQALAGYRPQIVASLSAGLQPVRNLLPDNTVQTSTLKPWTIGVTVTQNLFNGFKTANSVRVAELQVSAGREALRNVGQGVLLDAVVAYLPSPLDVEAAGPGGASIPPAGPQGRVSVTNGIVAAGKATLALMRDASTSAAQDAEAPAVDAPAVDAPVAEPDAGAPGPVGGVARAWARRGSVSRMRSAGPCGRASATPLSVTMTGQPESSA